MKEFLSKILGWKGADGTTIELFSIWHFLYIFIIAGAIVGAAFYLKNKSPEKQKKFLNVLSIVVVVWYIVNFFLQPFVTSDHQLNIDKLPFHICTLMGIVAVFAQFSNKQWFKEVAVILATTGSLMYITYPGSALGDISPWCFKVIETFGYHGLLMAWGILNLTTKQVKLHYKNMWMPLVGILVVAAWATVGNICYNSNYFGGPDHYDWFFLTGSTFNFIPYVKYYMPILVIVSVYGVASCLYLIYYICEVCAKKIALAREQKAEGMLVAQVGNAEENNSTGENDSKPQEASPTAEQANKQKAKKQTKNNKQ